MYFVIRNLMIYIWKEIKNYKENKQIFGYCLVQVVRVLIKGDEEMFLQIGKGCGEVCVLILVGF